MSRVTHWSVVMGCMAGAALMTYATYLERNYPIPEFLIGAAKILEWIHVPSFMLAAELSHNVHAPSDAIRYGLVFLAYMLIFLIATLVVLGLVRVFASRRAAK